MIGVWRQAAIDPVLLAAALALATFSALMVPSAAVVLGDALTLRHWAYLGVAAVTFAAALLVPTSLWLRLRYPALILALVLCALVLVPGVGLVTKGARRWIDLGFFTLQSSEFAKVLVLIFFAGVLQQYEHRGRELRGELWRVFVPLLVLSALLLAEPDFGTVVVLWFLAIALLFLAGVRLRLFALMIGAVGVAFAALIVWQPYRLARVTSFINPWADPYRDGYQLTQSLIAFGRGGYFGQGLGEGVQKLEYLPDAHNDFIFAVIVEEFGLIGALTLIVVFAALVLRLLSIGRRAALQEHWHGSYLAYGVALLLGGQFLINLGVSSGALPTKGLTLPFVSFGGNSLIVCALLLALAVRVQIESDRPLREVRGAARRRRRPTTSGRGVRKGTAKRGGDRRG
ncbi:MAG: putative lipid II flippase FtsW [Pseudomonadota bacterium]